MLNLEIFSASEWGTVEIKHVDIACDTNEAEQFREWLRRHGVDAKIGSSTSTYINGERNSEISNRLWDLYCNG